MIAENRIDHVKTGSRVLSFRRISQELQTEFFRKSIHMLIAMVPTIASVSRELALSLLGFGIAFYSFAEFCRLSGRELPFISRITVAASRERDNTGFVLGPITLAMGAMLALLLYPSPAASVAIYSLAFGDSLSSIAGKMFGRIIIPGSGGKTLMGSAACFVAVFLAAYEVLHDVRMACVIACFGTILEALPLRDFDNIVIPVGTGLVTSLLFAVRPML